MRTKKAFYAYSSGREDLLEDIREAVKIINDSQNIKISDSSIKGLFIAKGRVQIVEGWRKVEKIESKDNTLPFVEVREDLEITNAEVTSHLTKPPKHHTEKTLLRVMETCGKNYDEEEAVLSGFSIGTPATTAETIKKLKGIGYIFSKEKILLCSELGRKIVETFPVKELFDLEFTGKLVELTKNEQDVIFHHAKQEPKK